MLDENGDPMQVYMTEEGVLLRLSNGQLLDKPLTPTEAAQKIADYWIELAKLDSECGLPKVISGHNSLTI